MIIKYFDLKKNLKKNKFFLFYGNNKGLIRETIDNTLIPSLNNNIFSYEEIDVLKDKESFRENLINKSFFEKEKIIIVNRVTDKFFKIVEEIVLRNIEDLVVILVAGALDKKSKIRKFFEKESFVVCTPFYEDNIQTLTSIAQKFLRDRKINISQQDLNILAERARGDRINLKNELQKIENFLLDKKKNYKY